MVGEGGLERVGAKSCIGAVMGRCTDLARRLRHRHGLSRAALFGEPKHALNSIPQHSSLAIQINRVRM